MHKNCDKYLYEFTTTEVETGMLHDFHGKIC